jgi:glycosyltransferase involved in cell wall biosynthesis
LALVGPTYPFRGGISHYTTLLARELSKRHAVLFVSFSHGYPRLLFPGVTDRDVSRRPVTAEAEYLIAPLRPWTWLAAARRIRGFRPDALIVQWWLPFWAPALASVAAAVRRSTGAAVVFVCHNVMPHEGGGALDAGLVRLALGRGDAFLVHSLADAEAVERLRPGLPVRRGRLPVHDIADDNEIANRDGEDAASLDNGPAGAERSRADGTAWAEDVATATSFEPPLPSDARVALQFGFVRHYKGLDVLVRALPAVVRDVPNAHLAVAGEFWEPVADFRRLAERLGVADRLHVANGYVPNENVPALFRRADVVVLPYRTATQSGVATLAHRYGVPLVVTTAGGLQEAVAPGRSGLVVPADDVGALASALSRVLGDDAFRATLRRGVLEERRRFAWPEYAALVEDVVGDGIARAAGRRETADPHEPGPGPGARPRIPGGMRPPGHDFRPSAGSSVGPPESPRHTAPIPRAPSQRISVVIPSLDSPVVDRVIRSVRSQSGRTPDEILVVGRDARGLVPRDGLVRLIETPTAVKPGTARNLGAAEATGDLLVFLDADCIPEAGWLAAHEARHRLGESVVGGAVRYDADSYWRLVDNLSSFHICDVTAARGPRPFLPTLNLSVQASVFRAVGPMDTELPRGEDLDWTIRSAAAGYPPFFESAARVWHRPPGRDTAGAVLKRWGTSGSWMVLVRRRHPAAFGGRLGLYRPWTLRLLSPLIALAATWPIFRAHGPGWRYPRCLPGVYATKLAWCWGAARPAELEGNGAMNNSAMVAPSSPATQSMEAVAPATPAGKGG